MNELSSPEISIIIPTFNRGELLGETLDSIRNQTFKNWECLVIDDGSTDYTPELIEFYVKKDQRFKYYLRPQSRRKGANSCRNYGFELSKGKYINFFDSDDLMHPDKLGLQLSGLKKGNFDYCISQSVFFEKSPDEIKPLVYKKLTSTNLFWDYMVIKIKWMTPSALWKKSLLQEQDFLFDENLDAAQEWEFHLRMIRASSNFLSIEEKLNIIRKHGKSKTYAFNDARSFHYFLARLKIYQNERLVLNEKELQFLEDYLLKAFKRMIITNNKFKWKAWRGYILKSKMFSKSTKLNALFALVSFHIFGKGNIFLQKIKI